MAGDWLPPEAPGAAAPRRWDAEPESPAPQDQHTHEVPSRHPPAAWQPPAPGGWQPPGQPQFVRGAPQPANGQAVAALVLGIVGLFLLVSSLGILFVLALPCSIIAWVLGVKGRRRADEQGGHQRGLAQAGLIMGMVGTVVGTLAAIGWILLFALGDEAWLEDLEQDGEFRFSALRLVATLARAVATGVQVG